MPSVTFTITFTSGTDADKQNGATLGALIQRSGSVPSGSYVTGASIHISALRCYASQAPYQGLGGYGTTGALSLNANTHSQTVSAFVNSSILNVASESITISVHSSGGGNIVNIRSNCVMTLTVDYAQSFGGSTASLSPSLINAGSSTTVTINNASLSQLNHTLTWTFGSFTVNQNVSTGVGSASFSVPLDWMTALPSSTSGSGSVSLYTYSGGTLIGMNSYTFTVVVPETIIPTIGSVTATRIDNNVPSNWGVYIQNKSGVTITANDCMGAYGSSIVSYLYSGGVNASSATNSHTVNVIANYGDITFNVRITDSRGRTATKSTTINVTQYSTPIIMMSSAYRCLANGEANENGTFIGVRGDYIYSDCGGRNIAQLAAFYARSDTIIWSGGDAQSPNIVSIIGNGSIDTNFSYRVMFRATDAFGSIDRIVDVSTSLYTIFFKRGGQGVAFGKVSEREMAVEINPDWRLYHGNVDLIDKINNLSPGGGGSGTVTPQDVANVLTKAMIEAKLTGLITTHTHSGSNMRGCVYEVSRVTTTIPVSTWTLLPTGQYEYGVAVEGASSDLDVDVAIVGSQIGKVPLVGCVPDQGTVRLYASSVPSVAFEVAIILRGVGI